MDSGGGLLVGALVLTLAGHLSSLYALPLPWIHAMGTANLAYGCSSGALAVLAKRRGAVPRALVFLLAGANLCWSAACVGMLARAWPSVGALGVLHLALEGVYVAGLGVVEARLARRRATRGEPPVP